MAKTGMSEILGKVRVPKKTKEAVAMNESYSPTQTAIQYWQAVEGQLTARRQGYEKALLEFKNAGGFAKDVENNVELSMNGAVVRIIMDASGHIQAVDSYVPFESRREDMVSISNATTAIIGLGKSEAALRQLKELRAFVENDGLISGMNNLVNRTILENPVLTALTMVPEDARASASAED